MKQPLPNPDWAQHALAAAARGAAVFPLLSKHVIPVKWGREATQDPDKIRCWADAFPGATGYGIALRQDVYVFDADSSEAVDWCRERMPRTYEVSTGRLDGGVHFYFRVPDGRRLRMLNTRLGEMFGVPRLDGKTAGGYVVGPGSVHSTGRRYEVLDNGFGVAHLPRPVADRIGDRPPNAQMLAEDSLTPAERTEYEANAVWGSALRAEAIGEAYAIKRNLVAYLRVSDERWADAFLEASIRLGVHVPTGALSYDEAVAFMDKIFQDEDHWGIEGNVPRSIRRGIAFGARDERKSWL